MYCVNLNFKMQNSTNFGLPRKSWRRSDNFPDAGWSTVSIKIWNGTALAAGRKNQQIAGLGNF